ncbi:hypothetical protein GQ44DRAFT_715588 [Phaeosphaeriaceae sp. PMI808]|nr:hypothetical protein GQ44DRAFT_715588 [Phaeosphaeriaceae sp. PMI808]
MGTLPMLIRNPNRLWTSPRTHSSFQSPEHLSTATTALCRIPEQLRFLAACTNLVLVRNSISLLPIDPKLAWM